MIMERFQGFIGTITSGSTSYVFAGPTATVTLASNERLFGAAEAPLGTTSGTTLADVGLCYQLGTGTITNFVGFSYSINLLDSTPKSIPATAATDALAAGTYTVGLCVRNGGSTDLDDNDYVNGWVAVID
jgi:hypothetical protein